MSYSPPPANSHSDPAHVGDESVGPGLLHSIIDFYAIPRCARAGWGRRTFCYFHEIPRCTRDDGLG
jgi:hypothetical protein